MRLQMKLFSRFDDPAITKISFVGVFCDFWQILYIVKEDFIDYLPIFGEIIHERLFDFINSPTMAQDGFPF